MSSGNKDLAKKVAVGAVIGLGGALGLYYLLKKYRSKPGTSQNAPVGGRTVEELKQLGNKLFSAKKYHEAIEIFTRAIELEEAGSEGTKAMCYQNRGASKERASNFSDEDALEDYAAALEMNPNYGKAYLRRGVLFQKNKKYREALVEIFCGTHLDSMLEKNANGLIPLIIEELEKIHHSEFNKNHSVGARKPVRHERVYAWLNKTVVNDPLKKLILSKSEKSGKLGEALQLIQEHIYDDVSSKAAEEDRPDSRLEALLLAAKFSAYENCLTEARQYLDEFTAQYNNLIELEKESKKDLLSSKFIIEIETAPNKEAVLKTFYEAIATDIRNIDYYAMAAFRLVIYGEAHEAMKILSTQDIDENSNIKLLRLTLGILANSDGNPNAAGLHTAIIELETFVRGLEKPSAYASTLLAKVYSTFSQAELATELMAEVIKSEPEQSIHYFDRGCMSSSGEEALLYLKKCLELEPYHAEANLMYASLMLNELGSRIMTKEEYDVMIAHLDRALETFDGAPDFPVVTGVFRLREVLEAKLIAGKKLGLIEA